MRDLRVIVIPLSCQPLCRMPANTLLHRPSIKCVHSFYRNYIFAVDHFSKLQFVCAYEITVNFIVDGVCNPVISLV